MSVGAENLSVGGHVLYTVARALGARVTSAYRTPEANASLPGSLANSKHLTGDAIDISADAPKLALAALSIVGRVVYDPKGTAPHYHVEVTPFTLAAFAGAVVGLVYVTKGVKP